MNNSDDFFYDTNIHLNNDLLDELLLLGKTAEESLWQNVFGMSSIQVSPDILEKDSTLEKFLSRFNCQGRAWLHRMSPNSCYTWHIDPGRNVALNCLLEGFDSECYFGTRKDPQTIGDLITVDYENYNLVLLNVKKLHTVFNHTQTRYLLNIGVDPETSYHDAVKFFQNF